MLVRKFDDQQLKSTLLAGKKLRLKVENATPREAVAELAKQSGYPVEFAAGQHGADQAKITLDTGETTFWEALHSLSAKANLVENSSAPIGFGAMPGVGLQRIPPPMPGLNKVVAGRGQAFQFAQTDFTSGQTLQLAPGKPADLPTFSVGSVRIRVLKATAMPAGVTELLLEVIGEPRLEDFSGGVARIDKAIDDKGQPVVSTVHAPPGQGLPGANQGLMVFGNNGFVSGLGSQGAASGLFKPFLVMVHLQRGDKAAAKLRELSGTLAIKTVVDTEPMLVVDKILNATGQTTKGKDGRALTVSKAEQLANGDVRVQIAMEMEMPAQNPFGGFVRVQVIGKAQANGNVVVFGPAGTIGMPINTLRLLDTAGKSYTQVEVSTEGLVINGGQLSQRETILFRPSPGQAAPAKLIMPGQREFVFDVPFTLKDIVLP